MRLCKYLEQVGESQAEFAKRSGVGQATLSRIIAGGGTRLSTAMKISVATGGRVRLLDLLHEDGGDDRVSAV